MVTGILLFLYVLFGRVLPWSLAITITILIGRKQRVISGLLVVSLMGLLEDIIGVRPLGLSSLILLCLLGLSWWARRQYRGQWIWWYILGAGGEILFRLITGDRVTFASVVWQLVILWAMRQLLKRVGQSEGIYVGQ